MQITNNKNNVSFSAFNYNPKNIAEMEAPFKEGFQAALPELQEFGREFSTSEIIFHALPKDQTFLVAVKGIKKDLGGFITKANTLFGYILASTRSSGETIQKHIYTAAKEMGLSDGDILQSDNKFEILFVPTRKNIVDMVESAMNSNKKLLNKKADDESFIRKLNEIA